MQIIESLTEQTTALTDIFLGVFGLIGVFSAFYYGKKYDKKKGRLWIVVLGALAFLSFLGAVSHGLVLSDKIDYIIWQFLNFSLGIMIAYFALGTLYDLFKYKLSKSIEYLFIFIAFAFYIVTIILPDSFLPFVIYESIILFFVFFAYLYMALKQKLAGSYWMVTSVFLTVLGAVIQSTKALSFTLILQFDHNGVFHFVQILGVICMVIGLRKEMALRKK